MLNIFFGSVVDSLSTAGSFMLCSCVSIILGLVTAFTYMYKNRYTKGFVITLALLPVMVQVVISLVNGNLGTGVAVMGAFSLIRFRSVPGSARDISCIFMSMALGLATGMGYIGIAVIFAVIVCAAMIIYNNVGLGAESPTKRELKITIPENLDYNDIFDDLFYHYTTKADLVKVKTTNMGSLYQLFYSVTLKKPEEEKELLDEIRCRNGNLDIICSRATTNIAEEL